MRIKGVTAWFFSGLLVGALAALLPASGCTKKAPSAGETAQSGVASWYGHPFDGRLTANGETYDMEKLTAAHRTLPFGTVVRVENLSNSKTVEVRINDRGPFVQGRIIDLSHAAAQNISMPGIANVRLVVVHMPANRAADVFTVQIGAFTQRAEAELLQERMEQKYGTARVIFRRQDETWRVLVGLEPTLEGANALAQRLDQAAGPAFVVLNDSE